VLVFKQVPKLAMPSALGEFDVAELAELTEGQVAELTRNFRLLAEEVQTRQEVYDKKMVAKYHQQPGL
jgi:hypothetical protein